MKTNLLTLINSTIYDLKIKLGAITADKELVINGDFSAGNLPQIDTDGKTIKWIAPGSLGGGTVTSVALDLPNTLFDITGSPVTGSGTLTGTFKAQTANTVFASNGASAPSFRLLVPGDIPTLDATKISTGTFAIGRLPVGITAATVAAGNDSRFHTQGTDSGTTSSTFFIGTGGPKVKNESGAISVRNNADTAYADLIVKNLLVQGTTTTINTEEVTISDNVILLNSDFTGATPTEDAGFEVERGTQVNAKFIWSESNKRFVGGLVGSEFDQARVKQFSFVPADVTTGNITVAHNMGRKYVSYTVWLDDEDFSPLAIPTDTNTLTLNVADVNFSTINVTVVG